MHKKKQKKNKKKKKKKKKKTGFVMYFTTDEWMSREYLELFLNEGDRLVYWSFVIFLLVWPASFQTLLYISIQST